MDAGHSEAAAVGVVAAADRPAEKAAGKGVRMQNDSRPPFFSDSKFLTTCQRDNHPTFLIDSCSKHFFHVNLLRTDRRQYHRQSLKYMSI